MYSCCPLISTPKGCVGRLTGNSLYCTTPRLKPSTSAAPSCTRFSSASIWSSSGPIPAAASCSRISESLSSSGGSGGSAGSNASAVSTGAGAAGRGISSAGGSSAGCTTTSSTISSGVSTGSDSCNVVHNTHATARIATTSTILRKGTPPLPLRLSSLSSGAAFIDIRLPGDFAGCSTLFALPDSYTSLSTAAHANAGWRRGGSGCCPAAPLPVTIVPVVGLAIARAPH